MKITFFSNFLNHHQLPFCLEMYRILGDDFVFVSTELIPNERLKLGYQEMKDNFPFLLESYLSPSHKSKAEALALASDFVIFGSAPKSYIKKRIKKHLPTLVYSERIFKNKNGQLDLRWFYYLYIYHIIYRNRVGVLSASYYLPKELKQLFVQPYPLIQWGYFPRFIQYTYNQLKENKANDVPIITWIGRMIDWKHPEHSLEISHKLVQNKINHKLYLIGNGNQEDYLKRKSRELGLDEIAIFTGAKDNNQVRQLLLKTNIFIFTSDYNEGWGAVLNEAMNAGCICIVNEAIGSAKILIKHNISGLLYKNGDIDSLYTMVAKCIQNLDDSFKFGFEAYKYISEHFNASVACKNLIKILNGSEVTNSDDAGSIITKY